MALVTPKQAASSVFVTRSMIVYWVKKGLVKKHYTEGNNYNYLVDLDEVELASKGRAGLIDSQPKNLITRQEAADLLWVSEQEISYYATKGYIKRHYVLGNSHHYLVDRDEVLAQPKLIDKRVESRKPRLRELALNRKKDRRGWFLPVKP
jgi:DNA-binding transcriptional MerR regulator